MSNKDNEKTHPITIAIGLFLGLGIMSLITNIIFIFVKYIDLDVILFLIAFPSLVFGLIIAFKYLKITMF